MARRLRNTVAVLLGVVGVSACAGAPDPSLSAPSGQGSATGLTLVLSASVARPGEALTLDVDGATADAWIGGIANDLETFEGGEWRRAYILLVDWHQPASSVRADDDFVVPAVGVRPGPFTVLVPPVADGEYRVRRDLISTDFSRPIEQRRVTLYAPLTVRRR